MTRRRASCLALAIVACLALSGCTPATSLQQNAAPSERAQEMVGTRFSSSREPSGPNDPAGVKYKYDIKSGAAFTGYYEVDNVRKAGHTYTLLAFVDYKQVPFEVDGQKSLVHTLTVDANQVKWWPIKVGPFPDGAHTFTTVLIWDSDNHSLDPNFRFSTESGATSTNQATFVVGPSQAYHKPAMLSESSGSALGKNEQYDGVRINTNPGKLQEWLLQPARPGQKLDYYIHVGNTKPESVTYSLIALLDGVQIPVAGNPGATTIRVPSQRCSTFKTSLKAPLERGVHELLVVKGVEPFTPITGEEGMLMEMSIRVPIVVE